MKSSFTTPHSWASLSWTRLTVCFPLAAVLAAACCGVSLAQDGADQRDSDSGANAKSILSDEDTSRQPRIEGGRIVLPGLMAPTIETAEIGNGRTPEGFRQGSPQPTRMLPESPSERGEPWNWTVANWAAANTFSHPRYFEDRMLERHGHERHPHLQPLASGARFFATVPMLPYLMVVRDPCDCESTLGYYRSGSCAPIMFQRPPYERRAVIGEAAAIAGTVIALP